MATERRTAHESGTQEVPGTYITPVADFLLLFVLTLSIAIAGVAILLP